MTEEPETTGASPRAIDGLDWSRSAGTPERAPAAEEEQVPPPPPRPSRGILAVVLAGVLAGLVAGGVAGSFAAVVLRDGGPAPAASPGPSTMVTVEQTSAIAETARRVRASVVRIDSTRRVAAGIEHDVGSGVVMDNAGHILTNAHVVLGTDSVKVVFADGSERAAILLGHDFPFTDLAVLQVGPGQLQPIEIGDSGTLALGDPVIAIGNPLAEFEGTVTVGVVSGLNRRRVFDAVRQDDLIQTDAAINNGNSGGALVTLSGQFVGMPTAILRQSSTGQIVEGISFALPSARIVNIARGIIAEGASYPRPTMGLEHTDLNPTNPPRIARLAVDEGALVTQVASGGPAASAGIVAGDVITRVGDYVVDKDNPLLNALLHYSSGETVRVVLNRNGRIIEIEVRLAKRS
jgi:2-alkenal reductase